VVFPISDPAVAGELTLLAPIAGWATPLAEVADPVFAQARLGDGAAIDPTGSLLQAPCAGVVGAVHAARHALTLRAQGGLELLLHVGLETVGLGGAGLEVLVKEGDRVAAGAPLIRLDLDSLAQGATSLITPVVITERGGFVIVARHTDRRLAAGDPFIELRAAGAQRAASAEAAAPGLRRELTVGLEHGLHARPAARAAVALRELDAEVIVESGSRRASARSVVALMSLGARKGDLIALAASGPDAQAAMAALVQLIAEPDAQPPSERPAPSKPSPGVTGSGEVRGVSASPGLAIGTAFRVTRVEIAVPESGRGHSAEHAALAAALAAVRAEIGAALAAERDATRASLLQAHQALLEDPELRAEAGRRIEEGKSAGFAWRAAVETYADLLGALADPRMAERVDDLRDLERRVLAALTGGTAPVPEPPPGAILLAERLLPSELLAIPAGRLAGLAIASGGPTSHVAVIAAAMGLPALVAAGPGLTAVEDGATVILDADAGVLHARPGAAALKAGRRRLAAREAGRAAALAEAQAQARLADGEPIAVLANLAGLEETKAAVAAGAEGCGLLRTEFQFLGRDAPPGEEEQTAAYQAIADALAGRPLVVRLLDIGADKPASYLPNPVEENPALGVRGVRLMLRRPELLQAQLRAILKVNSESPLSIMVPMVSSLSELRAVRATLDAAVAELGVGSPPELGVMIETPAAAIIADQLAAEARFLSIGSNDLAQYALAMDRGHPDLAGEVDALAPAVLRLIAAACEGAAVHARPVGVCGALAGDPAAIPILIGLGVSRLSMAAPAIGEAKALIRQLTRDGCRALAVEALSLASAGEVRALVRRRAEETR
jgi:phosphocarrier protein FPr/phosphocarrier protein